MSETIKYRGYTIHIEMDDDPQNPRTEWDNAGRMVTWHRRYNLGDEQPREGYDEWLEAMANVDTEADGYEFSTNECIRLIEEQGTVIMPLYLYDHSGLSISTGSWLGRAQHAQWDSGQVGWIYATKEQIQKEWDCDKEKAIEYLKGEVEIYDDYLTGNVYGYRIEEGDSCWGYFGDTGEQDALQEAKSSVDWEIKQKVKKHIEQVKKWIKAKVPVIYRKPLQMTT